MALAPLASPAFRLVLTLKFLVVFLLRLSLGLWLSICSP